MRDVRTVNFTGADAAPSVLVTPQGCCLTNRLLKSGRRYNFRRETIR